MTHFMMGVTGQGSNPKWIDAITDLSLTTNLQVCLDAGDENSYTSGTKFLDVSGNGYDFDFGVQGGGTAARRPTFNGVAGDVSENEYMSVDGSQFFTYDSANETWMDSLHKNNAKFTFAWWARTGVTGGTGGHWFGTTNFPSNSPRGPGIQIYNGTRPSILAWHGSGTTLNHTPDDTGTTDVWTMFAWTEDEAGGANGSFLWNNGSYNPYSTANTWDGAYSSPSASAAMNPLAILDAGGGDQTNPDAQAHNGTRLGMVGIWSGTALTKANLDDLYAATRGRYGV